MSGGQGSHVLPITVSQAPIPWKTGLDWHGEGWEDKAVSSEALLSVQEFVQTTSPRPMM